MTSEVRRLNVLDSSRLGCMPSLTLSWMDTIIARAHGDDSASSGNQRRMDEDDLFLPTYKLAANNAYSYLRQQQQQHASSSSSSPASSSFSSSSSSGSIFSVAWRLYGVRFILSALLFLVYGLSQVLSPAILKAIILALQDDDVSATRPVMLAIALGLLTFIGQLSQTHSIQMIATFLFELRAALANAVYRKLLRLNASTVGGGAVVNLMATDGQKMLEFMVGLHMAWSSPLIIGAAMYFLHAEMGGWAMCACLATMMSAMPIGGKLAATMSAAQRRVNAAADDRLATTTSVLEGIQVIKYYGWSRACAALVEDKRSIELSHLRTYAYVKACSFSVFTIVPFFASVVTFLVFSATGGVITAANAFTTLALIHVIQFPFTFLPLSINYWLQSYLSLSRIDAFLGRPELLQDHITHTADNATVNIDQASFDYRHRKQTLADDGPLLPDVNFRASAGQLVAVIGSVASGKSLLLCSILGEASRAGYRGTIEAPTRIAYVPQTPFIRSGTVRDNIVFGQPWNEQYYTRVVHACQLSDDFAAWAAGDLTEIGERGVNISGGQKQRITLARAAYDRTAELIVMDDSLSAVDPHVSERIFAECIRGVMAGRTRVLVTNSLKVASECDHMYVMKRRVDANDGGGDDERAPMADVATVGPPPPPSSSSSSPPRRRMLRSHVSAPAVMHAPIVEDAPQQQNKPAARRGLAHHVSMPAVTTTIAPDGAVTHQCVIAETGTFKALQTTSETLQRLQAASHTGYDDGGGGDDDADDDDDDDDDDGSDTNITRGHRHAHEAKVSGTGSKTLALTSSSTVVSTLESGDDNKLVAEEVREQGGVSRDAYREYFRGAGGAMTCGAIVLLAAVILFSDFWGSYWIYLWITDLERGVDATHSNGYFIGIYAVSVFASSLCIIGKSILVMTAGLRASKSLHANMNSSLLRKKLSFFHMHPVGRILNRFSNDLYEVDMNLPILFDHSAMSYAAVLLVLALVSVITTPLLLLLGPITVVYVWLYRVYSNVSRALQRAEAVYRSSVYNHVTETVNGLASIRALKVQTSFIAEFEALLDCHQKAAFLAKSTDSWLQIRLDVISGVLILATCVTLVLNNTNVPVGISSLLMTQVLTLPHYLTWSVRQTSQIEAKMSAVERARLFSDTTDQETDDGTRPNANANGEEWPYAGAITFDNIHLHYRPGLPSVLNGIMFTVVAGTKVGLVGRTGSGKSSLLTCLFRIVAYDGTISVDGVDIQGVPLEYLRQSMAIIPQSPVLLPGTVRFNMDPLGHHDDEDIWACLQRVDLIDKISQLDQLVGNDGVSFSMGEKQLFCLARTLLRRPRILCLDEATASVDAVTDAKIQRTLKEHFTDTTVLTIAHRLDTILAYDRIAVLDAGRIVEYDSPAALLGDSGSAFSKMFAVFKYSTRL